MVGLDGDEIVSAHLGKSIHSFDIQNLSFLFPENQIKIEWGEETPPIHSVASLMSVIMLSCNGVGLPMCPAQW